MVVDSLARPPKAVLQPEVPRELHMGWVDSALKVIVTLCIFKAKDQPTEYINSKVLGHFPDILELRFSYPLFTICQ